jgi:hypothetical protein
MKNVLFATLTLFAVAVSAPAERPPQTRDKADLVLSGTVKKITTMNTPFGGTGVRTEYTAEVVVNSVAKGDKVKAGDTIELTWFHVTKRPRVPIDGAFGHAYDLRENTKARFWLKFANGVWEIIYSKDGVEKIEK